MFRSCSHAHLGAEEKEPGFVMPEGLESLIESCDRVLCKCYTIIVSRKTSVKNDSSSIEGHLRYIYYVGES